MLFSFSRCIAPISCTAHTISTGICREELSKPLHQRIGDAKCSGGYSRKCLCNLLKCSFTFGKWSVCLPLPYLSSSLPPHAESLLAIARWVSTVSLSWAWMPLWLHGALEPLTSLPGESEEVKCGVVVFTPPLFFFFFFTKLFRPLQRWVDKLQAWVHCGVSKRGVDFAHW